MENEDRPVARRELLNRNAQDSLDPLTPTGADPALRRPYAAHYSLHPHRRFRRAKSRQESSCASASRRHSLTSDVTKWKTRIRPGSCDLAKQLQEGLLGKILGFRRVSPPSANTVHRRAYYVTYRCAQTHRRRLACARRNGLRFGQLDGINWSRAGHQSRRDASGVMGMRCLLGELSLPALRGCNRRRQRFCLGGRDRCALPERGLARPGCGYECGQERRVARLAQGDQAAGSREDRRLRTE